MRIQTEKLERGLGGTEKTIAKMHKLVAAGKLDPTIQKIATWIRLQVPRDYRGSKEETANAVFQWLKRHQVFQRDPFQIEKIEHPLESMRPIIEARKSGAYRGRGLVVGDCDTLSAVYLASLLGALGFHYAFETVKVDARRPNEFSHVYLAVLIDGRWYPLDPSTKGFGPGERPDVPEEQLKRWPEKPIEETMGLNGHLNGNGMGSHGLGTDEKTRLRQDDWPEVPLDAEWLSQEEYGYGIPKYLGDRSGKPQIPETSGGKFWPLTHEQPAQSRQDMEQPLRDLIKRVPTEDLSTVGRNRADSYSRPNYVGKKPYVHVQRNMYPPGSRWGRRLRQELYDPKKKYIHKWKQREPVFRRADVVVADPVATRGRKIGHRRKTELVFMRPDKPSAGLEGYGMDRIDQPYLTQEAAQRVAMEANGMGAETSTSFSLTDDAEKTAKEASTSVWSTISKSISSLVPAIGTAYAKKVEAKYAQKVAEATARVTGQQIPPTVIQASSPVARPTPLWQSPFVIAGGVIILGGVAYLAMKGGGKKGGTRRRRRYRVNPVRRRRRVGGVRRRRRAA